MQPGQQCHRKPVESVIYNIFERNWSTEKHPYGRYISADCVDRSRVRAYKFSLSSTPNVHELWSIIMYCYMSWSLVEYFIIYKFVYFYFSIITSIYWWMIGWRNLQLDCTDYIHAASHHLSISKSSQPAGHMYKHLFFARVSRPAETKSTYIPALTTHMISIKWCISSCVNHSCSCINLRAFAWPDHVLPDLCINSDLWRKLANVWEHKRRTRSTGTTKQNIT